MTTKNEREHAKPTTGLTGARERVAQATGAPSWRVWQQAREQGRSQQGRRSR